MNPTFALAESSGWAIAALTGVTIALPYLARRRPGAAPPARLEPAVAYLERLRPHYWIGFTLAGLSLLHAGLAMSSSPTPAGDGWTVGIWVATGGLLLVFGQVSLGLGLRGRPGVPGPIGAERVRRRRLHLLTMALLVAGGLTHVVLNGPLARALLAYAQPR
jgi:hypothetical protein